MNMQAYLYLTCRSITEEHTPNTILLGVEHFPHSHTADNLPQVEDKIMEEWGIKGKVMCLATDAINMIACAGQAQHLSGPFSQFDSMQVIGPGPHPCRHKSRETVT